MDIKPVQLDILNCFEDQVVSIAKWFKSDYELMFAQAWGFDFNAENSGKNALLGDKIGTGPENILINLELYHNIQAREHSAGTLDELLSFIYAELSAEHPNIVITDSFWCPWTTVYRKEHHAHTITITGCNAENTQVYCTDGFYMKHNAMLPVKALSRGFTGRFWIFENRKKTLPGWDGIAILKDALHVMDTGNPNSSIFDKIRCFADVVENTLDPEKEFPGNRIIWSAPLYRNINRLVKKRRQFSCMLNYLSGRYNAAGTGELSGYFEQLANKWNIVISLLIKGNYLPRPNSNAKKIAAEIRKIADNEEEVFYRLRGFCENRACAQTKSTGVHTTSSKHCDHPFGNVCCLDLQPYMNNRGTGNSKDPGCAADLTGIGEYFLADNFPIGAYRLGNMEFRMPGTMGKARDNIACTGQTLAILPGIYSAVMILGCAEWGNFSGFVTLLYGDDTRETLLLEFTDCYIDTPLYGETRAFPVYVYRKKEKTRDSKPRYISAQCYGIQCGKLIDKIRLPEAPNIHIFALSLGTTGGQQPGADA